MKNYHTHTFRCNHAEGDAADYSRAAVEKGLTVLGITDHTPLPDNRWLYMRMGMSALPAYLRAIEEAQDKYTDLRILKGMECEWAPEYHNFFQEVLLGECELNYLILGCHFFPFQGSWLSSHGDIVDAKRLRAYTDFLVKSMQSGLFSFVAHPDLFGLCYMEWDKNTEAASKDILSAAADLGIPLEINGYGLAKRQVKTAKSQRTAYPWHPFWELATGYGITIIVNSDAHYPDDVAQGIQLGQEMAKDLGLKLANMDHLSAK